MLAPMTPNHHHAANGGKTFQPSSVNVTQTAAAAKAKSRFSLISKVEL